MNSQESAWVPTPRVLAVIIDRDKSRRLEDILREKHVHFHYMFHAMGTASSEILQAFGLSGTEKTVCLCMVPDFASETLLSAVSDRMELYRSGNGIVFTLPVSGISAAVSNTFLSDQFSQQRERWQAAMDKQAEIVEREARFELVVAVVNHGFSEEVMDAARASGARGGTIVQARHADIEDAVKFYGISLQAEKEIVAILVPRDQKKALMQAISAACGIKSAAHGVVFSLPVENCAGIEMGQRAE